MCGWVSESNKPRTFTQETAARVKPKVNGEFFQLTWRNVTFKYLFSLKPWFIPKSSRVILEPKPNKVLPLKPYNTVMLKQKKNYTDVVLLKKFKKKLASGIDEKAGSVFN